jgi:hypothetical protein
MNRTMDLSPLVTFTVILRPPVTEPGRSRRWSAHCLDLNLGVSASTASAVRMRLASSIAAHVALGPIIKDQREADPSLWKEASAAPLVTHQVVETDAGTVAVRYVQPGVALTLAN